MASSLGSVDFTFGDLWKRTVTLETRGFEFATSRKGGVSGARIAQDVRKAGLPKFAESMAFFLFVEDMHLAAGKQW